MEVGLIDVAALSRHKGGAVTSGETVSRVVETDQLGGALGGKADLGSEPGPQTPAAPSHLRRLPLDPNPPPIHPVLGQDPLDRDSAGAVGSAGQQLRQGRDLVLARQPMKSVRVRWRGNRRPDAGSGLVP
jgi:hypothetical protein